MPDRWEKPLDHFSAYVTQTRMNTFKVSCVLIVICLSLGGCTEQPEGDWYDQVSAGNDQRDAYIQHQVDAGLDPAEARRLHDLRFFTERTINMSRRDGIPEEYQENLGR